MKERSTTEQPPIRRSHKWSVPTSAVILVLAALTVQASKPAGEPTVYETDSGYVEFESRVPLHTFTGQSNDLVGRVNLADSTVDFYVDLATLRTGNGKRDKDMRTALNVDEHPFAEYYGKLITPFDESLEGDQPARTRGTFTVHGVSREIEVQGVLRNTPDGLYMSAEWTLNLEDYDIEPPRLLIVKVHPEQELKIEATLERVPQ